ncbi:uncharacterized protein DUF982 [Neorhizobium sp. JUb45]|nr:uncharacterized protein DUF982 [Neorhizobium sp. JUb45]
MAGLSRAGFPLTCRAKKEVPTLLALFDKPIYAQRRYFVQEITGLDDVFDFLDEWPQEKRNLAYETLIRYCREAANGRWPINAVRENFCVFLKQNGRLAELEDVPAHLRLDRHAKLGGL